MNKQQIAKQVRAVLKRNFRAAYATRGWSHAHGRNGGYFNVVEGFSIDTRFSKQVIVSWREHAFLPIAMEMNATTEVGKAHAERVRARFARHAREYQEYLSNNGFICTVEKNELGLAYVSIKTAPIEQKDTHAKRK